MSMVEELSKELRAQPRRWVVTGAAGFIGSNLVQSLLDREQYVVGLDNFATGYKANLDDVQGRVSAEQWKKFTFIEGDICSSEDCMRACEGADYVLHQAALGSVPRSVEDPISSNRANVDGSLRMFLAARDCKVKRLVYASSSSVYGDSEELPKVEERTGNVLSPYAVTKAVNELYAGVCAGVYGTEFIGLRYFNVFGPRQDPNGAYAAVIPRWLDAVFRGEQATVYGDGETSRDFCFIANVVQANILAACTQQPDAANQVYNIAVGGRTTLNELYGMIVSLVNERTTHNVPERPQYAPFRVGDIRHSHADISKAQEKLGYQPTHDLRGGLTEYVAWFAETQVCSTQ